MIMKDRLFGRLPFSGKSILAAASAVSLVTSCLAAEPEAGFTSIFDGQTLNGWTYIGRKAANMCEGWNHVCPAHSSGNLITEKEYSDFVMRFEFKVHPGGNNGVAVRAPNENENLTYVGVEVQLLDDGAPIHKDIKPWQHNGSVYGLIPSHDSQAKLDEWNTEELSVIGRHYKVVLNGRVILDGDLNDVSDPEVIGQHPGMFRERGHLGFLGHHSLFEFRNIQVKDLPSQEKENTAPKGFVALFNGEDMTGWKGLVGDPPKRAKMSPEELAAGQLKADERMRAHWKAEGGEIVFDGKGDSLCTKKDYGNFEMLVDWKIPAKGDSGIYLRGSPQVQIWEPHSPGQFNPVDGSGGLYNNQKNPRHPLKFADKPVGEWNRFRIVMVGEKVHVFLNGELVVRDTTLENYWERDKPIYPMGQLELQNHGGPLWFKNVYVREIPVK
ncbi:protein of unknown function DUF1080 [Pedosphaera parvula Ellin514]|uniref:3-keto-alpha-glucoside-1,2-lyase/3-keto-2-hydroxy-glucal hydratase domain-containing protein n=2 Tax=Pedosphaera TaxID=1032526 RepID=B9XK06_PEDPL|nr:protein of unknown function DUF1080 [Pedosphaera parvula Ellin514]